MCARSSAFRSRKRVRRRMISIRCFLYSLSISLRVSVSGLPRTSAMLMMLKVVSSGVYLKSWLTTTSSSPSFFSSMTRRILLSLSSRTSEIPVIRPSFTAFDDLLDDRGLADLVGDLREHDRLLPLALLDVVLARAP